MSINGKYIRRIAKVSAIMGVTLAIFYNHTSKKRLQQLSEDPAIYQYVNRLTEFFDLNEMDRVTDEFLTMIDFGMYPHEAFSIITFIGELN